MPDLSLAAHKLLALMTLVALWWITEPLPLPVTALLGPTLAVVIGIVPASTAFSDEEPVEIRSSISRTFLPS